MSSASRIKRSVAKVHASTEDDLTGRIRVSRSAVLSGINTIAAFRGGQQTATGCHPRLSARGQLLPVKDTKCADQIQCKCLVSGIAHGWSSGMQFSSSSPGFMGRIANSPTLRKTSAAGPVFPFAKTQKTPLFANVRKSVIHFASVSYDTLVHCMGCKGFRWVEFCLPPFYCMNSPVLGQWRTYCAELLEKQGAYLCGSGVSDG